MNNPKAHTSLEAQGMGRKRYIENDEETLRKAYKEDAFIDAYTVDSPVLLRNVDEDAINKCRLSMYGQMRSKIQKESIRNGDDEFMERCRDSKGDYRLDAREFPLEDSLEKIYFDYFGHGFNDSPVIDRPGAPYKCPCGRIKLGMSAKNFPERCPVCGRLTPLGELIEEGVKI